MTKKPVNLIKNSRYYIHPMNRQFDPMVSDMNLDWRNIKQKNQLWNLAFLGALKISGNDAKKLLQGQLTCDLEKITSTTSSMGALCNPQGRIISLFYLCYQHANYYLIMPRNMVALTQAALKKFAMFYKVDMADASDEVKIFGYQGEQPQQENILAVPVAPKATRYLILTSEPLHFADHAEMLSETNWRIDNLLAKIPQIFPETSGKILPHDIDLPLLNAIDFDKGCYTGQEIIARMQYRGKLKNHLYLAELDSSNTPLPNSVISKIIGDTGSPCGIAIDACKTHENKSLVLFVSDIDSAHNANLTIDKQTLKVLK